MSAAVEPSEPPETPVARNTSPSADARPPRVRLYYRILQGVCQLAFICLFRGRAFGRENVPSRGGVLLVCNHQSFFDPPLVGVPMTRECHFMARDTLFRHRAFSALIRSLNAFPVRRGTSDIGAMKEGLTRLKRGHALLIFPEGTRTRDGSIGPFHLGPLLLAQRTGVPIVPVVVHGAYECWPRDRRWPRRLPVTVVYGTPIPADEVQRSSAEQLAADLRARMGAMLADVRRRRPLAG